MLASANCYFSEEFANQANQKEFRLADLHGAELRVLIEYCYTGHIQITSDNIEFVYPAALKLKFDEIEEECLGCFERFLQINPSNVCHIFHLPTNTN